MDVFLIPTTTAERYELYYEAPDEDVVEEETRARAFIARMKRRFARHAARSRGVAAASPRAQPEPATLFARLRRKVMGFVVERIAEQRLLWHMRQAHRDLRAHPGRCHGARSRCKSSAAILKTDADHHLKWMLIDLAAAGRCPRR